MELEGKMQNLGLENALLRDELRKVREDAENVARENETLRCKLKAEELARQRITVKVSIVAKEIDRGIDCVLPITKAGAEDISCCEDDRSTLGTSSIETATMQQQKPAVIYSRLGRKFGRLLGHNSKLAEEEERNYVTQLREVVAARDRAVGAAKVHLQRARAELKALFQ